ncbi:vacuolar sorting protein [Reticulomyxa filosa]|uniref:Vacuolar protein sorting-associated protein 35 n=1 Tax=Reticulomyxa filosa TaxID=46433 RepID=X6M5Q5_RETFI|nr:vacuolar sorting protein [Reticulomyxa filosa]|eukprot:ETO08946.1 vacuolar sorting protein [Reticulomyxa filosa]
MVDTNNPEEQERYFKDATENVRRNAFYMQEELDKDRLHDAIKHAYTMIGELRTSKQVIENNNNNLFLCQCFVCMCKKKKKMMVTSELAHLETHVMDKFREKQKANEATALEWLTELYNRVQFCGNIVPRLYLLITVASVKLKAYKEWHEDTMKTIFDVVELSKGVQHPTRGLFLRNYLSQVCRSALPDVPDGVLNVLNFYNHNNNDDVGSLDDHPFIKQSVDFVLKNFAEMTRLWVRMQHQGAVRDRVRREKERLQLRMLVGTNLRRLSELNCISKAVYQDYVLKNLLENIVKSKDKIAQDYLMECIIMVFGDEYHLATLESFLSAVNKLHSSVAVNQIVIKLMNRLAKYAEQGADHRQSFQDKNVFETFEQQVKEIIQKHTKLTIDDTLGLYVELVNFAAQCYPGKDDYVVSMIKESLHTIQKNNNQVPASSVAHLSRMLLAPLKSMQLRVFEVKEYRDLISFLDFAQKRQVSADMVGSLVQLDNVYLRTPEQVELVFGMIEPLWCDPDQDKSKKHDTAGLDKDKDKDTEKGGNVKKSGDDDEQGQDKDDAPKKKDKSKKKADSERDDGGDSSCESIHEQHTAGREETKSSDDETFENEQNLMAKLIQLIYNEDTDTHYQALLYTYAYIYTYIYTLHLARKYFGQGGDRRLVYTFPPLVFNCLSLIARTHGLLSSEERSNAITMKPKKMFQFVHKICHIYGTHCPELGCRIWLQAALAAERCALSEISYEFFSQAFLCYEEYVSDSNEQYEALRCFISGLQSVKNLEQDNFDTLRSKCVQHAQRLLKKPHCARTLALCAHLYWDVAYTPFFNFFLHIKYLHIMCIFFITEFKQADVATKCLKKSGQKINSMMDGVEKIEMFVELLNKYVYLIMKQCPDVTMIFPFVHFVYLCIYTCLLFSFFDRFFRNIYFYFYFRLNCRK